MTIREFIDRLTIFEKIYGSDIQITLGIDGKPIDMSNLDISLEAYRISMNEIMADIKTSVKNDYGFGHAVVGDMVSHSRIIDDRDKTSMYDSRMIEAELGPLTYTTRSSPTLIEYFEKFKDILIPSGGENEDSRSDITAE